MNYDVGIFIGHGTSEVNGSYDPGAVSNGNEEHYYATLIGEKVTQHLINNGLKVHIDEQNYIDNDTYGNTYRLKYVAEIHLNAGGGRRSECYVPLGEKGFDVEEKFLYDMSKIGLANGGVKSRDYDTEATVIRTNGSAMNGKDYYKVIRNAWSQGISLTIFEIGFIDSSDFNVIVNNVDYIAKCLANRILELDGKSIQTPPPVIDKPVTPPTQNNVFYRVCVGSFNDKNNAENLKKELESKGYKPFIAIYNK